MYSEEKFEKQLEDLIEVSEDIWVNGILASVNNEDENIYGRKYNGINSFILSITRLVNSYRSNKWVTFNELRKRGGTVKKGEKSTVIFLWSRVLKKPEIEENSEELENKDEFYYLFKCFNLFNLCQTEGIEFEPFVTENLENHPVESADEVIEEYKDRPKIINDSIESAFYVLSTDEIHIPKITGFKSSESYYGALFHELAHSTGHSSRLNRKMGNSFGSDPYAKEELIAETTSTMICASIGLTSELSNSASYLKSWLRDTKEKRKAITLYSAFAQAEKAKNYILSGEKRR